MTARPLKDPSDPKEQVFRQRFVRYCRRFGLSYEHVIEAVYRRASAGWAPGFAIDGGAHKGLHTLPLASLEAITQVVAFEPSGEVADILDKRLKTDPNRDKVRLIRAALQDDPACRSVTFNISTTHPGRSGINPILKGRTDTAYEAPVEVAATTIDEICLSLPGGCRFIKLDLEGGEYNALRGARGLLQRDKPLMVFENGLHAPEIGGYTREALLGELEAAGMVVVTALGDVGTPETLRDFWYAWACPKQQERWLRMAVREEAARALRALLVKMDHPDVRPRPAPPPGTA